MSEDGILVVVVTRNKVDGKIFSCPGCWRIGLTIPMQLLPC
ncbi:hypothetical protein [Brevibacillus sp. BC25]